MCPCWAWHGGRWTSRSCAGAAAPTRARISGRPRGLREVPPAAHLGDELCRGTRFTTAKHADQQSPYQHLLQPKSGGLGMALSTIGELFTGLVDVTWCTPNGTPSFVDAMSGRLGDVVVVVRQQPIPPDLFKNGARQRAPTAKLA